MTTLETAMNGAPYTLLYTDDVTANAACLERFFGCAPVERSTTFALFVFGGGRLGLWRIDAVEPHVSERPGASEFALAIAAGRAGVDAAHERAASVGLTILQDPTAMDFGYTFTAALSDGNRIRIFVPAEA
ncbi:drug:proton antiporter [Jiella sp. MQZ9-1]|uniref:Drug:proton antiporter n=1 Tax=Jiella flava TaxID=2816857 RepID=A0A939G0S8_9HYPH|nr:drug:proton antiporter [Jiella flava]MBO0662954.1 drug:proton antiporter [Jiella flava]MCD2471286.1 drug:proton antiporter [Jiella flava]